MKKRIGILISGNFYQYTAYRITDAKGGIFYLAEPIGMGATRNATTIEELQGIIDHDVKMLNHIARENQRRVR